MAMRRLLALCAVRQATSQLQVIGAGLAKTGTQSLSEALVILGFGWNTHEHCNAPTKCQEYSCNFLEDGNATLLVEDIKHKKMQFVADEPLCLAYKELADAFPEAKVVLSVRDDPDQWFKSFARMQDLVFSELLPKGTRTPMLRSLNRDLYCDQLPHVRFDCDVFAADLPEEDVSRCKAGYEKWNQEVQRNIPKERLLVFNVKEGWEPLCKFLGKPVPKVPFPNINTVNERLEALAAEGRRRRKWEMYFRLLFVYISFVGLLLCLCFLRQHCRRKNNKLASD